MSTTMTQKSRSFYTSNAVASIYNDGHGYGTDDIKDLESLGVEHLSIKQANEIHFQKFFDSLRAHQEHEWPTYECLPKPEFTHIPIPYNVQEHDEHSVDGADIDKVIEEFVEGNFSTRKYLFSGDREYCLAMSFNKFTYEIINTIYSTHINTPVVLFDDYLKMCILFDFDLSITVISMQGRAEKNLGGKDDSFWIDFFNKHFLDGIVRGNQAHLDVINRNYVPRLPGVNAFVLPTSG